MNGRIWPRPVVTHIPDSVEGVAQHDIDLCGVWRLTLNGDNCPEKYGRDRKDWGEIPVPGEMKAYGYFAANKRPYAYYRAIEIPEDFEGMDVILRFEGANCRARVYVNGAFVREHYGGFNSWDADITPFVTAGGRYELTVVLEDRVGEMGSFSSGGLIRTVRLLALPPVHIERLHVKTEFADGGGDACLTVMTKATGPSDSVLRLSLVSPNGEESELGEIELFDAGDAESVFGIPCPEKWDCEHPRLYTLRGELVTDGIRTQTVSRRFGFRQVRVEGREMYVNGDRIKLHGCDRHDSHILTGHALTHAQIDSDIALFKEANVNFIRTSHYNPCQYFLDRCDEEGLYVELETNVSFIGQGQDMVQDDPAFLPMFMDQLAESLETNLSRPSVIMWSLCNECIWGDNFKAEQDYVRAEDPTRPTVFSYPMTIPDEDDLPDIWSVHYALEGMDPALPSDCMWRGVAHVDKPVLHDEFMHVPCYIFGTRDCDESVRDEWADTVRAFWNEIYRTEGALGGAIWCGIDVALWTERNARGLPWGIMDGFRRRKPELWGVRKGYSPIYIENAPAGEPVDGYIPIGIENRYNHTDLNEIRVEWECGGSRGETRGPDAAPGETGVLFIPAPSASYASVRLRFFEADGRLADEYTIEREKKAPPVPAMTGEPPKAEIGEDRIVLSGRDFRLVIDCGTGKIELGEYAGRAVISGGPHINLNGRGVGIYPWKLDSLDYEVSDRFAWTAKGHYGRIGVDFLCGVDSAGTIDVRYTVSDMPFNSPKAVSMVNGEDPGGYREAGMYFDLVSGISSVSWERDDAGRGCPSWHIGRARGTAYKEMEMPASQKYPDPPAWDWKDDMFDFLLYGKDDVGGRGTRDFSAGRSRVYRAFASDGRFGLTAFSDGRHQVRMEVLRNEKSVIGCRDPRVRYVGAWFERKDPHGLANGIEMLSREKGAYAEVRFSGTGIAWFGTKYMTHGKANALVDGNAAGEGIDLFSAMPSNSSKGFERLYRRQLFAVRDLPYGEHTLRIEVTGETTRCDPDRSFMGVSADNCYVSVDHFLLTDGLYGGKVRMYINDEYNFSDLSWGCLEKDPVVVDTGYTGGARVRMGKRELSGEAEHER